jgi:hypothetical protein
MPCRPSPEEEAWAAAAELDTLRQRAAEFDRQRHITIDLLVKMLADAKLGPAFVRTVLGQVHSALTTTEIPGNDERSTAQRLRLDAEISLCIARATLMQVIPLLPRAVVERQANRIVAERTDHLRHRLDDWMAESATLARRIADLTGSTDEPAELVRLRTELQRLRGLTPDQLVANREFTPGTPCPHCSRILPELPGLDPTLIALIAVRLGQRQTLVAIKLVRDATGLGLAQAKRYCDCPHDVGVPLPAVTPPAGRSPYRCPTCRSLLPPLGGLSVELADRMLAYAAAGHHHDLRSLLRQATGWSDQQARSYLYCPHRLPGSSGSADGQG